MAGGPQEPAPPKIDGFGKHLGSFLFYPHAIDNIKRLLENRLHVLAPAVDLLPLPV